MSADTTAFDDGPFIELRGAVVTAKDTSTRLRALSEFFAAVQVALSSDATSHRILIFNEAAFLLSYRVADGVVWDWWQEQARGAVAREKRIELRISLFEIVPEPPIIWSDLYRLWDFWFDPAARWAVFEAYDNFPRRLRAHLARYKAHRRRHKLPVPDFTYAEYHDAWFNRIPMAGLDYLPVVLT